jgi:hypothetical protein
MRIVRVRPVKNSSPIATVPQGRTAAEPALVASVSADAIPVKNGEDAASPATPARVAPSPATSQRFPEAKKHQRMARTQTRRRNDEDDDHSWRDRVRATGPGAGMSMLNIGAADIVRGHMLVHDLGAGSEQYRVRAPPLAAHSADPIKHAVSGGFGGPPKRSSGCGNRSWFFELMRVERCGGRARVCRPSAAVQSRMSSGSEYSGVAITRQGGRYEEAWRKCTWKTICFPRHAGARVVIRAKAPAIDSF